MKTGRRLTTAAVAAVAVALAACEAPPISTDNIGFRGASIGTVTNVDDSLRMREVVLDRIPEDVPPVPGDQPVMEPGTFQNVEVLGNLSVPEFNRTMVAMTNWVSPEQGCNYCHYVNPQGAVNMASENRYTKHVSRRMIQMVKYINEEWSEHVGEEGVNCWTCHVGQPQPSMERVWTFDEGDPNQHFYLDRADVRVQPQAGLTANAEVETSIQNARNTYWYMIETSQALGVNCTYCHNSARFGAWDESPPARVHALRGYRMVRQINQQYIEPLQGQLADEGVQFPDSVLGPQGDVPKVQCLTCHQGLAIPQYGQARATGYPGLLLPWAENPAEAPTEAFLPPLKRPLFHPEFVGEAP
jgi:photosynthetic reaction center cytochrome c subunit